MKPTLREVATRAGVSVQTVSDVLNVGGDRAQRYSPALRRRVWACAASVGYRPNAAARALVGRRFHTLALLLGSVPGSSLLPGALLSGLCEATAQRRYHLLIAQLSDEILTSREGVPRLLDEAAADGLLINYHARVPQRMVDLIAEYRLPAIWINYKHRADCVYPDDEDAAWQATRALIDRGHRHLAFVNLATAQDDEPWHYSGPDRQAGYERAMREASLSPRVWQPRTREEATHHALDFMIERLRNEPEVTALLGYTWREGTFAVHAARLLGWSIPEDLAMVVFHDQPAEVLGLQLATMILPERRMGHLAVQCLEEKMRSPDRPLAPLRVPVELHPGSTLAGVRHRQHRKALRSGPEASVRRLPTPRAG